ncbi:CRIB domain-containing protein RIC5-like [Impatiens glandulifera]|uniref:CRIB domain-containing protein RIC5-like n=1 Tax=Impatiens glandulifera TaxID=253017 RepID=UPI001FB17540|nr:CRIB domain-containing protein RIC5-like [Impatiens glandulifera]
MTTMKGLMKGLRYISQIFEEEKEDEIQIGFPTDVKHVAHIGSDGPSTNQPSWMNEFKPDDPKPVETQSRDIQLEGNAGTGVGQEMSDSPTRQKKQHRRHRSGSGSISSPAREPSSTTTATTKPRRPKAGGGGESPAREPKSNVDPSGAPKQSRKKKTKDSSGPDKLPRPKASQGNGVDSGEFCPSPAYDVYHDRDGRG